MRVIAGKSRGRTLAAPRGLSTRPTPGRVREAIFSILSAQVPGARVLDLFAGTGALGIEALSRGAREATFVEMDRRALAALRRNLEVVGPQQTRVLAMPVQKALEVLAGEGTPFELVFVDPPYERGLHAPTLEALARLELVGASSWIVCEHPGRGVPPMAPAGLTLFKTRAFGDVGISIYHRARGPMS